MIEPGGRHARVRGDRVAPRTARARRRPARVAVNLAGIEHSDVGAATRSCSPDQWEQVAVFDAALTMVPGDAPLRRGVLQAHVGSGVHPARVRPLDDGRFVRAFRRHSVCRSRPATGSCCARRRGERRSPARRCSTSTPTRRAVDAPARLALPLAERILAARPWTRADDIVAIAGTDRAGAAALLDDLVERGARPGRRRVDRRDRDARGVARESGGTHGDVSRCSPDRARHRPRRARVDARARRASAARRARDRRRARRRARHGEAAHTRERRRRRSDRAPIPRRARRGAVLAPVAGRARRRSRGRARAARDGAIVSLDGFYFSAAALDEARAGSPPRSSNAAP